jgi:TolA-binding protein
VSIITNQRGNSKTLWVYIVAIFASAFLILLLTMYSQIKFNKNIDEYKNKLSNEEAEKFNFQNSLTDALNENKALKETIDQLNKSISDMKTQIENTAKTEENQEAKSNFAKLMYERIIEAQSEYSNGNIVMCAIILKEKVQYDLLNDFCKQIYNKLGDKTFQPAAEKMYYEGYNAFKAKDYNLSMEKFKLSIKLYDKEYYSDDSYFFLGYSLYYLDNFEEAKIIINTLLNKYPDSTYKLEAERLLAKL